MLNDGLEWGLQPRGGSGALGSATPLAARLPNPAAHAALRQVMMVRELFALARVAQQERKLPGFRAQQWYFFFVAAFWMYIR